MPDRRLRPARFRRGAAALLLPLLVALAACSDEAPEPSPGPATLPPGLTFVPPAPGTYQLPPIQPAADGTVLDASGAPGRLHDHFGDGYAVLSFIYSRCSAVRACPFATSTLGKLRQRLDQEPGLGRRVRLVTLSFDPRSDTPEVMQRYASMAGAEALDSGWSFLTTPSPAELVPILEAYGQHVVRERDTQGQPTGQIVHGLKVFLVDPERRVRNIYSADFLHPKIILNDLQTLIAEAPGSPRASRQDFAAVK